MRFQKNVRIIVWTWPNSFLKIQRYSLSKVNARKIQPHGLSEMNFEIA